MAVASGTGKYAVGVHIAGQGLTLLQPTLQSTRADYVLGQRKLTHFGFLVESALSKAHIRAEGNKQFGVLSQIAARYAGVSLISSALQNANFAAVAGFFGAG